ncbi:MAG TPA: DUF4214 domain-containing protein [Noviherbaspirillum sp.]|uniref:DUF4214 domain-containing protein n=1 Tax=Noviherbaspirillum sp. TaxID=1926288 RepID=UPI002D23B41B|nr:DUF4214 domain-containing protein [Noviherbaspirillum sp.]HYD95285.1 DUF4214 domain-containing protein [Noviherbaspirillum sp.]
MNGKPSLTLAGIWTPVDRAYLVPDKNYGGLAQTTIAHVSFGGGNGLFVSGWGWTGGFGSNATVSTPEPVRVAVLKPLADGTLQLATSEYLDSDLTNGANAVAVVDFNKDGKEDVFLPAHNESPFVAKPSTLYLANDEGGFNKIVMNDAVMAHDAQLSVVNGVPTVIASTFTPGDTNPIYTWNNGALQQTIGARLSQVSHQSAVIGNFGANGSSAVAMGDVFSSTPGENFKIKIYGYADGDITSTTPLATITPYLSAKHPGFTSHYGAGITHTYRILTDDFNHDGKADLIAEQSMWVQGDSYPTALQMIQNQGNNQFADKTDQLAGVVNQNGVELDYQTQLVDLDNSGINSYLLASVSAGNFVDGKLTYDNSRSQNYLLLNDGTGKLHGALHEQFIDLGNQVVQFLKQLQPQYEGTDQSYYIGNDLDAVGVPKFVGYQTADGALNYVAQLELGRWAAPGLWANQYMFVNVPVRYNPGTDFTQNVTIDDRNGSGRMRTWAGNDSIGDTNAAAGARIDGGLGSDTAIYSRDASSYRISRSADGTVRVTGQGLSDTLVNVERLSFADLSMNLAVSATAATLAPRQLDSLIELYIAYFNRVPDADGMAYWMGELRNGTSLKAISDSFYAAAVQYASLTGYAADMSNDAFVKIVYKNVLGRDTVDADGLSYWTAALATGSETRASLVSTILGSAHTFKGDAQYGYVADLLDNKIAVGKLYSITDGLVDNNPASAIQRGVAIASAITPTDTDAAIKLIGIQLDAMP